MVRGFLLGVIVTSCIMSGLFFLRFWKQTRDFLFLCFAVAFFIEGVNRIAVLTFATPNQAPWFYYTVRLISALVILFGILKKNYGVATTRS